MKTSRSKFIACLRDVFCPINQRTVRAVAKRRLRHEQLEGRRVMTLPVNLTLAEGYAVAYNSAAGDVVDDTLSVDAFINSPTDVDSFYFAPQFTGTYTINVGEFGNAVDPEVAVYIANTGVRIGYNDDVSAFNDDARLTLNLTADVRYIVAVADQPATTTGDVSVSISGTSTTLTAALNPNTFGDVSTLIGLDVNTDIDYYSITAPADAIGNLLVTVSGATFTPRLALFDASGALVSGPSASINYNAVVPGQAYRVAVFSNNYASSGTATLNFNFSDITAEVTNTADSGPGSLRQAMLDANAHPNENGLPDKIRFAIPGVGPYTIAVSSALPDITEAVVIDASTQPGTGDFPSVAIDGGALTGAIDGLRIFANDTTVRKLNVRRFPKDGVLVRANNVLLESLAVGSDWTVENAASNAGYGIQVIGSNNTIFSCNVDANGLSGIYVNGEASDNNVIVGGGIGLALNGTSALPNAGHGILIVDGDSTRIFQVYISGNGQSGIAITGSATATDVVGNFIGTSLLGTLAVPNAGDGILIESTGNKIGGPGIGEPNTISGNRLNGIRITGSAASNNTVEGNLIGTNPTGTAAIPNQGNGVLVSGAPNNRIGSATDAAGGNVVSGNRFAGIAFSLAGVAGSAVYGNKIGTSQAGTVAIRNGGSGVLISGGATGVVVGGATSIARNLISGNTGAGVTIGLNSNNNTVSGNYIGTNVTGTAPLGNGVAGITVQSSGNQIGGPTFRFANRIAGNSIGINLTGAAATLNTIRFNIIGSPLVPNTNAGVQFANSASGNTLGPSNSIQGNQSGVRVNDASINNRITRNSFASNVNLGIDLLPLAGINPQDAGDADGGANRGQNSPLFTGSPLKIGNDLQVSFRVNSAAANSAYPLAIEFYSSDGAGEGRTYLAGTTYTVADLAIGPKVVNFVGTAASLVVGTTKIIALATDANGNTSEFSLEQVLAAPPAAAVATLSDSPQLGNKLDVNKDGVVSPLDALNIVNAMNTRVGEGEFSYLNASSPRAYGLANPFRNSPYDINGDGALDSLDLSLVVDWLQTAQINSVLNIGLEHEVTANDRAVEELGQELGLGILLPS